MSSVRLKQSVAEALFGLQKWFEWNFGGRHFSETFEGYPFPIVTFAHHTPLRRPFSDVDPVIQHNKTVNLRLACRKIDGLVVAPGEQFSFWRLVGKPSAARGFLPGMVLRAGTVGVGVGGGLCQLTNLLYWITLHTPLTVTERWRHSYDVFPDAERTQPFGSGATCSYPNIDLGIQNRTPYTFRLTVRVTATHLEGAWECTTPVPERYAIVERDHRFEPNWQGGYVRKNTLVRQIFSVGEPHVYREEIVAENAARTMYEPLLEKGS